MTHATDPLNRTEREAIFPAKTRWVWRALVTLACGAICVLIITEHLWRPLLHARGW